MADGNLDIEDMIDFQAKIRTSGRRGRKEERWEGDGERKRKDRRRKVEKR